MKTRTKQEKEIKKEFKKKARTNSEYEQMLVDFVKNEFKEIL